MNMKEIEAIVLVSKNKSFYETAFALNYAPSTISKYVSNVEDELGVSLFVRGNRPSSVTLTKEGEMLLPKFEGMFEYYSQIQSESSLLRRTIDKQIAIGTGSELRPIGADELMTEFSRSYPDVSVKHMKCNATALIQLLLSAQLDVVFIKAIEGSRLEKKLLPILNDSKIDVQILNHNNIMYMGISEMDPLARFDEAPITAFNDFSIIVHSNRDELDDAGTYEPFIQLSQTKDFTFRPLFVDTRDASAYYLATTQSKVAAPAPTNLTKYPGIKFIRVTDWERYSTTYFFVLKSNRRESVMSFRKCVTEFIKNNPKQ